MAKIKTHGSFNPKELSKFFIAGNSERLNVIHTLYDDLLIPINEFNQRS